VNDKNTAPDATASAPGPFTQMATAIDAAEHAHFMRRLRANDGGMQGWGTVTYGRSTPFAFPDNVTPVAAIVSPPRPFRLYGGVSIEATTASASGEAKPSSRLSLAVIGRNHFGNPIPQQWYAAAHDLLADIGVPAVSQPVGAVENSLIQFFDEWEQITPQDAREALALVVAKARAAQPVQAGEAVDEHEQAIDLMRKLERDGLEFVCMDGSANVVGIIKAAWKYRASLAPVAAPELAVLTNERIAEIYRTSFEGMPGAARNAPKAPPLVIEFGKAIEREVRAAQKAATSTMEAPIFWYRPIGNDGLYEGPVHNNSVGGKRLRDEKPGEWVPLYRAVAPVSAQQGAAEAAEKPGQWGYNVLTERMEPRENGGFYLAREADKWAAHPTPAAQAVDARPSLSDHAEFQRLLASYAVGEAGQWELIACINEWAASPASTPEAVPEQRADLSDFHAYMRRVHPVTNPHPLDTWLAAQRAAGSDDLSLAVRHGLAVSICKGMPDGDFTAILGTDIKEMHGQDPCAATRRAIRKAIAAMRATQQERGK
jgi:hypothetical protein